MQKLVGGFVASLSAVAALYFVYWTVGAALASAGAPHFMSVVISFVAAIAVARYVWLHSASAGSGFVKSTMMGALVTGAVGFSAGFFGPMIFTPSANQGPLLGIFITGPLGLMCGGAGGAIHWFARGRHAAAAHDRLPPSP
jgi:hypothetical protein